MKQYIFNIIVTSVFMAIACIGHNEINMFNYMVLMILPIIINSIYLYLTRDKINKSPLLSAIIHMIIYLIIFFIASMFFENLGIYDRLITNESELYSSTGSQATSLGDFLIPGGASFLLSYLSLKIGKEEEKEYEEYS